MTEDSSKAEETDTKSDIESKDAVAHAVGYDELLSSAGEFGRYQFLLILSTCPFYMFSVFTFYSQLFMTVVSPNHWCWIPELANLTEIERRDLAIPNDDYSVLGYSQCTAYVANWSEVLSSGARPDRSWDTEPCRNGWEFNGTEIPYPTISSDLGWVCHKRSYQASAQLSFFVGSLVGGIFIGWVCDRFGRIPASVVCNVIGCIGGFGSTFANNLIEFALCRFIMGMCYDNCMMMTYLLVLEYVVPKHRSLLANASFAIFYTFFATTLPFLALKLADWRTIGLVTSLPLALAIFSPLVIPESPRWLISKGRIEEAIDKIRMIGRINKHEVPTKLIEKFKETQSKAVIEENMGCGEIFKRPLLRNSFIISCLLFMCSTIIFHGLVFTVGQLNFDFFLSFAAASFTEFPSVLLSAFAMDYFGRRWLSGVLLMVTCVFSILTGFLKSGIHSVVCAILARLAANVAYTVSMQWPAELMPTAVRGKAVSFVHVCGFVSSLISPYIVFSGTVIPWLPMVIIASVAAFGAAISMILPETVNRDMPNTFEDAENLSRNQKLFELPCLSKSNNEAVKEYVNKGFDE